MIKLQKMVFSSILAVSMLLGMSSVQAALVNYTITGDVIFGDEYGDYNAFGLTEFETITATGVFDDSVLTGGSGIISFAADSGNTMTLNVGSEILTASNDEDYAFGAPTITLSNFALDDFDYYALSGINGAAADFSSYLTGFDDFGFLYGEWQTNVVMSPVPVPAALWLMGSGLIGLAGVARRKQK